MTTILAGNNGSAINLGIGAVGVSLGAQNLTMSADLTGVQPSEILGANSPATGGDPKKSANYSEFSELLHRPVKDHVEYADLLFETIQKHQIPVVVYEPLLRRKIGQLFAKNGMSLEALKYFLQKFSLNIEDEEPSSATVLKSMYSWPKTIREGIYQRVFEAHFNSDPEVERLTIVGIESARQKTRKALENFYKLEEVDGIASKMKRAYYKRAVLIAFSNDPVKFEFENQIIDIDLVFRELDRRFDARVAGIQQQFSTNRAILSASIDEFGLKNDAQRIEQSRFNKFLNWYSLAQLNHPYLTAVTTVGTGYVGGSIIAKAIVGAASPVTTAQVFILGALSLYYGWETPRILETVDMGIPQWRHTSSVDEPTERHEMQKAIKKALLLKEPVKNIREAWQHSRNINKVGRRRAEAFMFGFSPSWTVRHSAALGVVHGQLDNAPAIALAGLETWAFTLAPIVYLIEPVIQGRIPLRYRFLSQTAVIVAWHTVASLFALTEISSPPELTATLLSLGALKFATAAGSAIAEHRQNQSQKRSKRNRSLSSQSLRQLRQLFQLAKTDKRAFYSLMYYSDLSSDECDRVSRSLDIKNWTEKARTESDAVNFLIELLQEEHPAAANAIQTLDISSWSELARTDSDAINVLRKLKSKGNEKAAMALQTLDITAWVESAGIEWSAVKILDDLARNGNQKAVDALRTLVLKIPATKNDTYFSLALSKTLYGYGNKNIINYLAKSAETSFDAFSNLLKFAENEKIDTAEEELRSLDVTYWVDNISTDKNAVEILSALANHGNEKAIAVLKECFNEAIKSKGATDKWSDAGRFIRAVVKKSELIAQYLRHLAVSDYDALQVLWELSIREGLAIQLPEALDISYWQNLAKTDKGVVYLMRRLVKKGHAPAKEVLRTLDITEWVKLADIGNYEACRVLSLLAMWKNMEAQQWWNTQPSGNDYSATPRYIDEVSHLRILAKKGDVKALEARRHFELEYYINMAGNDISKAFRKLRFLASRGNQKALDRLIELAPTSEKAVYSLYWLAMRGNSQAFQTLSQLAHNKYTAVIRLRDAAQKGNHTATEILQNFDVSEWIGKASEGRSDAKYALRLFAKAGNPAVTMIK